MIALVVAVTQNGVIGRAGGMPWHLPADLAYFKQLTSGHPIIMGRKTHESIGRALPNRTNIIITRQKDYATKGDIVIAENLTSAIAVAQTHHDDIFIIGGGQIFIEALSLAQQVYLNRIHANIEGDTFFPELDAAVWQRIAHTHRPADDDNVHALDFDVFARKNREVL